MVPKNGSEDNILVYRSHYLLRNWNQCLEKISSSRGSNQAYFIIDLLDALSKIDRLHRKSPVSGQNTDLT